MKFRLTPNTDEFYVLFSESASNMLAAVKALAQLVDDPSDRDQKHEAVKALERKGDDFTDRVHHQLDSSFVTPFDREDIHALAEGLDDVVDEVYHISEVLTLVPTNQPLPEFREQVRVLLQCAEATVELIDKLSSMKGLRPLLDRIDKLESEGDGIFRRSLARLFSGEIDTLEVLKWKGLVDAAESALDRLEDLATTVASISVKHA